MARIYRKSAEVLPANENALRESEERFRELADNISQFAWTADRVAELILSFKQVAADQVSSDQRTFDLGDLIGQVLVSLRPSLRKHNLTLDVECQPNLV